MIVKLLYQQKSGALFPGVRYNTNKVDRNKGELMKVANFGVLQGFSNLRPQDYVNYLKTLAALNPAVKKPQFHAVISGKGHLYDKARLTAIAENWLKEMGYGRQPYLIIYHKDTENNHVHIVSSRVDRKGEKINSAYEKIRSQKNMSKVLGYEYASAYRISTKAQYFMLLEQAGFAGLDPDHKRIEDCIAAYKPDVDRIKALREVLLGLRDEKEMLPVLKDQHSVELLFHAAEGKQPYGYTIIDHQSLTVYKGSEVLGLKELLGDRDRNQVIFPNRELKEPGMQQISNNPLRTIHVQSIWIAGDVDDQQIHGMRRRRQRKARTNTR
ncbi:relaxase/mobilization nuclease-like protein [Mucilaginibacter yixingensis]|uniref:Relaxase/mobilization nuclease-like protein n=1 Tax=Mucilaginibacter yixingensis TaxID=1295612 RepID=A0A2T5J4E4_9SPHI|nr:relaxase/mobilization nuclease domain-containing protein [Mucilaginibacter yixingensis]PTQ92146.1 relaxase/mobilization nuclease-like protein [Mucilaginibacter yixingensis]